ncbi:MAG: GYF domain-containing protein [Candidatus Didemnitutus sp.]|nr:GYF domain-containing protein [Candidatus Didemnitutus sp.]
MFTIIGADGKEYGPVSTDQLREWIASGRANAQTQCRRDGESAWSTLGSLPEFTAAFSSPPPRAEQQTGNGKSVDPEAYAARLIARNASFDFGAALTRSWELLLANFWPLVGVTFVLTLITAALNCIPLVGLLANGIFIGGLQYYYLKRLRGQAAEIGDCFIGFNVLTAALIIGSLLVSVFSIVGLFFLIIPGIYLIIAYQFTFLLIIDHRLEFWSAMEVSRRVITRNWFWMLLLVIVGTLLSGLGVIVFFIGYIFTAPILHGMVVSAYEQLVGRPD